jgi:hypothetical protein
MMASPIGGWNNRQSCGRAIAQGLKDTVLLSARDKSRVVQAGGKAHGLTSAG